MARAVDDFALTVGPMAADGDLGAGLTMVSGWMRLGLNRTLSFEMPMMGARFARQRVVPSLPLPFLLAGLAWAV